MEPYFKYLYGVIFPVIRDKHEAEDILQETLLQIYRSLNQYRNEGFKTWIARIAVRKAIDLKRAKARKPEISYEVMEGNLKLISDISNPEADFLSLEQKSYIQEIYKTLPDIYQIVIEDYYFHNKSYKEIAELRDISLKTVESRLYRARDMLRKKVEEG